MRFIKKILTIALVFIMVFTLMPVAAMANDTITVTIDGQQVTFADQQPTIINGRTLVPVRGVFEALGFYPTWSGSAQTATLTRDDYVIVITIGSATFTNNSIAHELDVPAMMINGRTMLPLRAVLESVGYDLDWIGSTRTVVITTMPSEVTLSASQIRQHLGVDYTILPREYTIRLEAGIFRWQFLELDGQLDINNFPWEGVVDGLVSSYLGDVFIKTWPNGYSLLYVDIGLYDDISGARRYNAIPIEVELNPVESVNWIVFQQMQNWEQRMENLAEYNMSRQYSSENFHWYSTDARSQWLPDMAVLLEEHVPRILDVLGIQSTPKISILYYSTDDFNTAYPWMNHPDYGGSGLGGYNGLSIVRPRGSTDVTPDLLGLMLHEFVHVLQFRYLIDREAMNQMGLEWLAWVVEGTAGYLDGTLVEMEYWRRVVVDEVRRNRIPTIESFNDYGYFSTSTWPNYFWAATIFEFISSTFGMEYVIEMNRRHGDFEGIFGFSQDEFQRQWHQWLRDNYR